MNDERKAADLFPPRESDSAAEARLRASLNAYSNKVIKDVDAALALRTAPPEAQRLRHRFKNTVEDACLLAMRALERAIAGN